MSNVVTRQSKAVKMLVTTVVLFILALAALALFGCSAPPATEADPKGVPAMPVVKVEATPPPIPTFGDVVSYSDGLSISVSEPSVYVPTDMAAGMVEGQPVVIFEFVLTNNSDEPFDPSMVIASALSGGKKASGVFDTSNDVGFPPATSVIPGESVSWNQAWSVADPLNITLETTVGFLKDPALFVSSK